MPKSIINNYIRINKMTAFMKYATTLDEQVEILKNRGLVINDEDKAKEVLIDIGYYRFGAYLFPFEKKYPSKKNRDHIYKDGANFLDALDLYYFDCDLRRLLMKYLNRIEVNIRTYITYYVSNLYKTKPCWFISHAVMKSSYVSSFYTAVYGTKAFQDNPTIIEHHKKYPMDRYAPAWKTIELMTIGNIRALYNNLKKPDVQADIAQHYGVAKISIFQSYFETIRKIRNMCAHGNVLFDTKLPQRLPYGPAGNFNQPNNSNIMGIIGVVKYFIKQMSIHRHNELCTELEGLLKSIKNEKVREILKNVSGFETF